MCVCVELGQLIQEIKIIWNEKQFPKKYGSQGRSQKKILTEAIALASVMDKVGEHTQM